VIIMNNLNAESQFPPTSTMPTKRFPVGLVILGVAILLIALAILGGIRAFKTVGQGSAEAITIGNQFIDSMGQHNYQTSQTLLTSQLQARTPAGNLKDIETLIEKHHGSYVNHGEPEWNVQSWNGQTSVRLAYPLKFTKSNTTVTMTLLKTDKGYQVNDTHYDF